MSISCMLGACVWTLDGTLDARFRHRYSDRGWNPRSGSQAVEEEDGAGGNEVPPRPPLSNRGRLAEPSPHPSQW